MLSGETIVEFSGDGPKIRVIAEGGLMAEAENNLIPGGVRWRDPDSATGSWVEISAQPNRFITRREMDPLGADVSENPWALYENPNYLNLKDNGERAFFDGDDPFNPGSGCSIDGLPLSCSRLDSMMAAGAVQSYQPDVWRKDRNGLPSHPHDTVIDYGLGIYVTYLYSASNQELGGSRSLIETPQNPPDESGIEKAVRDALATKACQDFAAAILGAQKRKGFRTLNAVASQFFALSGPHFTRTPPPNSTMKIGNPIGRIARGTAQIYSRGDGNVSTAEQMLTDADTAIAELFHLAAKGEYYTDKELAEAVHNSSYGADADSKTKGGLPFIDPRSNPFDPRYIPQKNDPNDLENSYSRYFHAIQRKYCTSRPGSERGVGFQPQ